MSDDRLKHLEGKQDVVFELIEEAHTHLTFKGGGGYQCLPKGTVLVLASDYDKLAALPPAMTWTTTKPTKPGWYWWRSATGKTIDIHRIERWDDDLVITTGEEGLDTMHGSWAGPIAPPEEVPQ